jgi:CRP-like cAMP-binding protein
LVWISASIGTDFVSSVFWNVIFITINSWQIIALLRDNQTVAFNEEEKNLYHGLFENFKPGEFLKIVRLGQWQDLRADSVLIRQGEFPDGVWVLSHGEAEVYDDKNRHKATLGANDLIGEMSYLTRKPPSATVRMETDGRALFWQQKKLEAFFRLHPTLKFGYQSVISTDLAAKLRR